MLPVDFHLISKISATLNSEKVIFPILDYNSDVDVEAGELIFSLFLYPVGIPYLCYKLVTRHDTNITFFVMDLKNPSDYAVAQKTYIGKPKKLILTNQMLVIFSLLQQTSTL